MMHRKLTQERVHELFDYHKDGYLIRKIKVGSNTNIGDYVGINCKDKYKRVAVDGVSYKIHRLIWLWHYGYFPENYIDHIDRNPVNNKIENLREVSQQCNARNCKVRINSTSKITGVGYYPPLNKWKSHIAINRKVIFLGYFFNFEDAVLARWKKEVELKWNGCNSTSSAYLYLKEKGLLPKKKLKITKHKI